MPSDQIRIGVNIRIASTGVPVYIFYESVNTSHQSESIKQKQNEVKKHMRIAQNLLCSGLHPHMDLRQRRSEFSRIVRFLNSAVSLEFLIPDHVDFFTPLVREAELWNGFARAAHANASCSHRWSGVVDRRQLGWRARGRAFPPSQWRLFCQPNWLLAQQ